jgi:hypothetical protein
MKSQLREGPIYGTLPILYVFLARTGKTVHELNFVSLDEQGNVQIAVQGAVHLKRFSTPSLTLKFLCAGKLNPRTVSSACFGVYES